MDIKDDDRRTKILTWIDKNWNQDRKCPICNSRSWNVNDITGAVPTFKNETVTLSEVFPFIIVGCNVCGYSLFFNEVVMGLSPPFEEKGSAKKLTKESSAVEI